MSELQTAEPWEHLPSDEPYTLEALCWRCGYELDEDWFCDNCGEVTTLAARRRRETAAEV